MRPWAGGRGSHEGPQVPWRRALTDRWALVALGALLYWVASHSLRPFVVVRLDELGAGPAQIGLVAAAYSVVALFVAVPAGRVVDRIGVGRVLVVSLVAMAALGVAYAFATTIVSLLALQVVNGVVELFVWLALQTLATHAGAGDGLAKQLALFSFCWGLGIAVGPTVGGMVYDGIGFSALALLYTVLSLAMLVAALLAPRVPAGIRARGGRLGRDAWSMAARPAIRAVLMSSFVAMYVISIKNTFYPLALQESGISLSLVGVMLSVMGVASLGVRTLLPSLLRWFGAGPVMLVGSFVGVAGISATPWLVVAHPVVLVAAAALTGAGYGSNPPVAMQVLGEQSRAGERGLVMGLRAASSRLAQVVQPLAFGGLVATAGTGLAFPASGAVMAFVLLVTRRDVLALRRKPPPAAPPHLPPETDGGPGPAQRPSS